MAWIFKEKKQKKYDSKTEKRKKRQKMYHDPYYIKIRKQYMIDNPLCVDCLNEVIQNEDGTYRKLIHSSEELHHLKSPFNSGLLPDEAYQRLIDISNFAPLCKFHHNQRHINLMKNKKKNY